MPFLDLIRSKDEIEYNKIITNLKTQLKIPYSDIDSDDYKHRISEDEHKKIFEEMIKLLGKKNIKKQLLKNGEMRFPKKEFTSLPRTVQILKEKDYFVTYIEAKSKIAGGKRDPDVSKQPIGKMKKCKPSFEVPPTAKLLSDQKKMGDTEYCTVSLGTNLTKRNNIEDDKETINKEVELSRTSNATVKLNVVFYKDQKDELKCTCYAKKGETLGTYLRDRNLYEKLSLENKNQIFYNLLKNIYLLHSIGIIHQDIKPENIIIFYNKLNQTYDAKFTDLGNCSKLLTNEVMASAGFESPEMVESNYWNKYLREFQDTYGDFITIATAMASNSRSEQFNEPNDKNDMWALGVVYLFLNYARNLSFCPHRIDKMNKAKDPHKVNFFLKNIFIKKDFWINNLLNTSRYQRLSSSEAVEKLQQLQAPETRLYVQIDRPTKQKENPSKKGIIDKVKTIFNCL